MDDETKDSSKATAPRRSTRSTRGSIKPLVNLKQEKQEESSSSEASVEDGDCGNEKGEACYSPETAKAKRIRSRSKSTIAKSAKKASSRKSTAASSPNTTQKEKFGQQDRDKPDLEPDELFCVGAEKDNFVEYKLTKEEKREIDKAFDTYDTECFNFIHRRDLKSALRSLGYEPRSDEIQRLTEKYAGVDQKDKISREDFHRMMRFKIGNSQSAKKRKGLPEEISKVFGLFDLDKIGKVTFENLKSIAKELGEKISDEELQEMIAEADLDGDHQVDESEFLKIMKKTSLY